MVTVKQYILEAILLKSILKRSFNISDNEYLREYENAARDSVWSDWVRERKHDIKEQITVLESLIERLSLINATEEIVKPSDKIETKMTNASIQQTFTIKATLYKSNNFQRCISGNA